jgi:type IV pilus assembly protein PilX
MNIYPTYHSQKGAALIVSLIILVAMTLLGITSMKGTSSEMAMAGNLRESALTFQAAEAGLRSGESIVENSTSSAMFKNSTNTAYLDDSDTDPDYLDKTSWGSAQSASGITLAGIKTNPKFFIKYLGEWAQNPLALVNIGSGYGGQPPGIVTSNYRVTSRGTGQTDNTFRTVQSYYGVQY